MEVKSMRYIEHVRHTYQWRMKHLFNMGKLTVLSILLIAALVRPACAQEIATPEQETVMRRFQNFKMGVYMAAITQDADGFIWLGLADVPVQWDGVTAKKFSKDNSGYPGGGVITSIYQDREGLLWFATM